MPLQSYEDKKYNTTRKNKEKENIDIGVTNNTS